MMLPPSHYVRECVHALERVSPLNGNISNIIYNIYRVKEGYFLLVTHAHTGMFNGGGLWSRMKLRS